MGVAALSRAQAQTGFEIHRFRRGSMDSSAPSPAVSTLRSRSVRGVVAAWLSVDGHLLSDCSSRYSTLGEIDPVR